jgi:hypothetical protein
MFPQATRSFDTAAISDTHAAVRSGADVSARSSANYAGLLGRCSGAQTAAMGLLRFDVPSQTLKMEDRANTLALLAADLFW